MKILSFLPRVRLVDGGVVKAVLDWIRSMTAAGHEIRLLTFDATDFDCQGGEVRLLEPGRFRWMQIRRAEIQEDLGWCEIVHLHQVWLTGNVAIARAIAGSRPIVLSTHGMLDDWSMAQKRLKKLAFLWWFREFFRNQIDCFHCTAEDEAIQVSRNLGIERERCEVIPLFCDLVEMNPEDRAPQQSSATPVVLFLSRLHVKKGIEFLIRAVGQLVRRGVDLSLVIAGPGDEPYALRLKQLVREEAIESITRFPGMVRGEQKQKLFDEASVFVLPTYQENFGLALIESLAHGVPVVTTKGTDIWRELQNLGAVIVDQSPEMIAEGIMNVLDGRAPFDPDSCRIALREWLNTEKLVRDHESMYQRLLDLRRPATA